jgi:SSS family solute:Na+ symporter
VVFASMASTCVLWVTVALLTPPDPEPRLIEFFRRARPLGSWEPIARKAGIPAEGWAPIWRGLGIAVLGAVMVGAGIVGLSTGYVGRWGVAVPAAALSVGCGLAFWRLFGPFVARYDTP